MWMKNWPAWARIAAILMSLAGCAQMQSHDKLATQVQSARGTGGPAAALKELEASATTDDERKALLYNLERGELLRENHQYKESTSAWLIADAKVGEWENMAKTNPTKLFGMLGAATISERLKPYEGQDYEKVWLTTRLALNRTADNDWDNARVDIKRTHEREAVIAEFRAKETVAAEEEAKKNGAQTKGKEINGYPVETLNDPEVLKLKNGYQNALSHYLAGFLYEVLNEPGLAAPGYRQAIELKPDTPVLEEGLRGLDTRTSFTHRRKQAMTDVLFIVESGSAPARKPRNFTVPVPVSGTLKTVSIAYPVIEPSREVGPSVLSFGDVSMKAAPVVDLNVMARRALKDEMPGLVLRGITRAVTKGVFQDQMQKNLGGIGGLLAIGASVYTEQADDRMWRTLPGLVSVARGYLPPGEHRLVIDGRDTGVTVKVSGQYALVPIRIDSGVVNLGDVASYGQLMPTFAANVDTGATAVPAAAVIPVGTLPAKAAKPAATATTATTARKAATIAPPAAGDPASAKK